MRSTFIQHRWHGILLLGVLGAASASSLPIRGYEPGCGNNLSMSEHALMQGRVDEAIGRLHTELTANPNNSAAHLLLCRSFYAEELADEAVNECEAAMGQLSANSNAQDWMGRAYGLKADRSGPLAGFRLATKVKTAFEAAVRLDSKNDAAANDLSEYYIAAPSIVGGGLEKATALAERLTVLLPQQAHRTHGLVAEKSRDFGTAEREFRAAVGVAGRPDAWTDLGNFYARRGDSTKAVDALRHALDADRTRDASLVDIGSILIDLKEPALAGQALRAYLTSGNQSDAAPVFKAHVKLGGLLANAGDKQAARAEFDKALALAHDYAPAQKAIQQL